VPYFYLLVRKQPFGLHPHPTAYLYNYYVMKLLASLWLVGLLSLTALSQETPPARITTYQVELNALKHQFQVDGIQNAVLKIDHVTSCHLNWNEYRLTFVVEEGNERGNFPMEKLKEIILENNAQLVKFTKEIKK